MNNVGQITFELDEFRPFRTPLGILECVIYGEATIAYEANGEWTVDRIELDQYPAWILTPISAEHPLWAPICKALEEYHADRIAELIAADAEKRPRSERDEHGTLNRAQQGV